MSRKIVITGASSEIGRAIARRVIQPGDTAVLTGHRNLAACSTLLADMPGGVSLQAVDLNDREALAEFCQGLSETDILINAAACTITRLLPELEDGDIDRMVAVNIMALVKLCRAVVPGMLARRSGRIVNVSSVTAQRASRGQSVYAGTKGFVESFTRGLAAEYGPRGVRANCVAPGPIDAGSIRELMAAAPDEVRRSVAGGALGAPDDVAQAVAYLCGPGSGFINGAVLAVNGGYMNGV
jgi:3-oxoacyl-[acyl-carrier protein] reductase